MLPLQNSYTMELTIGKIIVDEAMKIALSTISNKNEITICRCSMHQALSKINSAMSSNTAVGFVRFVFVLDEKPLLVLLNADGIVNKYKSLL